MQDAICDDDLGRARVAKNAKANGIVPYGDVAIARDEHLARRTVARRVRQDRDGIAVCAATQDVDALRASLAERDGEHDHRRVGEALHELAKGGDGTLVNLDTARVNAGGGMALPTEHRHAFDHRQQRAQTPAALVTREQLLPSPSALSPSSQESTSARSSTWLIRLLDAQAAAQIRESPMPDDAHVALRGVEELRDVVDGTVEHERHVQELTLPEPERAEAAPERLQSKRGPSS